MAVDVARAGVILAVSDFARSVAFYRDQLGFEVEAEYDDPPYATLGRAGMWGGDRCFAIDPDRHLIELEEPA